MINMKPPRNKAYPTHLLTVLPIMLISLAALLGWTEMAYGQGEGTLLTPSATSLSAESDPNQPDDLEFTQVAEIDNGARNQSVSWQPTGNLLLLSGEDGVYVYDSRFEKVRLQEFPGNPFVISTVWSQDGERAVSLLQSGQVIVWRVADGSIENTWDVRGIPLVIDWSHDDRLIAVGSDNGYGILTIFDTTTGSYRETLTGDNAESSSGGIFGGITSIGWHPNNRWIVLGTNPNPTAIVWDTISDEQIRRIRTSTRVLVSLNSRGTQMVLAEIQDSSSFDDLPPQPMMYIWPIESLKPEKTIPIDVYGDFDFGALAWRPQGLFLAIYNFDDQLRIWDAANWQVIAQLPAIERDRDWPTSMTNNSIAWSPDGKMLADAGDGRFRVWRAQTN